MNIEQWIVNVSEEYNVSVARLSIVFQAINKFHKDTTEVRNMIEKGLLINRELKKNEHTRHTSKQERHTLVN